MTESTPQGPSDGNMPDPVLAGFLDLAQWFMHQRSDGTPRQLVEWVGAHLTPESAKAFSRIFRIDHPDRIACEQRLSAYLRGARQPTVRRRRMLRSAAPTRATDWAETAIDALMWPPDSYLSRPLVLLPDNSLLASLASLARRWAEGLRLLGGPMRLRRADHLLRALDPTLQDLARRAVPLDGPAIMRLQRHDAALATLLRKDIAFWDRADALEDFVIVLAESAEPRNANLLLELIARLAIARAALWPTTADESPPWTLLPPPPDAPGDIVLLRDGLECRICKTPPPLPHPRRDRFSLLQASTGIAARQTQPDLVLRFRHRDQPPHVPAVYVLGDAKNNRRDGGESYLIASLERALRYQYSYGEALRLVMPHEPVDDAPDGFVGPISPSFALFCFQGASRVLGHEVFDEERAVSELASSKPTHSVLVFNLDHYCPAPSRLLIAWFERVARQAQTLIADTSNT